MRVAREEIFGPVGVVIPFDTDDEALDLANDNVYGLSATVWTRDVGRAHSAARRIEAGAIHKVAEVELQSDAPGVELPLVDRVQHMPDPGVALVRTDAKGQVTQAQPGMTALQHVLLRPAEVLHEKQRQSHHHHACRPLADPARMRGLAAADLHRAAGGRRAN